MKAYLVEDGVSFRERQKHLCYSRDKPTLIPYRDIVDVTTQDSFTYITHIKKTDARYLLAETKLKLDCPDIDTPIQYILAKAYPKVRRRRVVVIINPHGGKGKALSLYKTLASPVFESAGVVVDVFKTEHSGHAQQLARDLVLDTCDAIICVSGDGIPHEVINGLASRPDAVEALKTPVCQLPAGSGNGLCHSLNGTVDWAVCTLNAIKGVATPMDLMRVSQGNAVFYSFLTQAYGIVADIDLGTEDWRWMGDIRFALGILLKALEQDTYPMKLSYKPADAETIQTELPGPLTPRYGNVDDPVPSDWVEEYHKNLSVFYVGNTPYVTADGLAFPHAQASDGTMDMILWDTSVGRIKCLELFDKMQRGTHTSLPALNYQKILAYRLTPLAQNYLSIDGESYPCDPFQVEVMPAASTVVSVTGSYYAKTD